MKISLVTLINNESIYQENVIESTLKENNNGNIEYIQIHNSKSGSSGLNEGLNKSTNDLIICCHQDITFLEGWYDHLLHCLDQLDLIYNIKELKQDWGVAGFAGTTDEGKMVGTHSGLGMDGCDTIECQTLDCSTLILRKSIINKYKLKFDEKLTYYHMYGEDISLQSLDKGLKVCCLNVPIIHNCKWTSGGGFKESVDYIKLKWKHKFSVIYTTVGNL